MGHSLYCDYCHKPLKNKKPFIPVRSNAAYHWKCYIQKVKEKNTLPYSLEESEYDDVNMLIDNGFL